MNADIAIRAEGVGKCFSLFEQPSDRLKQLLWGRWRNYSRDFWALKDVSFEVCRGEVVGLVGRNGAGKSTLLQMVCGTLLPSVGSLQVTGRVAALLELGAGFSPDFSGLENVYMNAAILGLSRAEVDAKLDDILAFADIGAFIAQPVKTYSSGMFMRLAFAVATSVDPDILVIDEALSVGDGAFSRKSFDRIMALKDGGATILFCSHAMYHVQALCSRAFWLEGGRLRMVDTAARVTSAYETALVVNSGAGLRNDAGANTTAGVPDISRANDAVFEVSDVNAVAEVASTSAVFAVPKGSGRIKHIEATSDGHRGRELVIHSGESTLRVRVDFAIDPALASPSIAVGIVHDNGHMISSAGSANDAFALTHNADGYGSVEIVFEKLALLRGDFRVDVYLACERGLHCYEFIPDAVRLRVVQTGLAQGYASLPHHWNNTA